MADDPLISNDGKTAVRSTTRLGFRRAGLTVLVGSGSGFAISLLLTPFIARLFSPSTYGAFAIITAWVSVFVGISTFRLEVYSQRITDDDEAVVVLRLATLAALGWGIFLTVVGFAAVLIWDVSLWWAATGALVTLASLQLTGTARLTRDGRYRSLAIANFIQGAGTGAIQLAVGLFSATVWALLAGFGAARLVWLGSSKSRRAPRVSMLAMLEKSRRFAAIAGASAGINSFAGQLPILLSASFYGPAKVGFLAMAVRILVSPLSLVGQAAAAASIGEVGRHLRERDSVAVSVVKRGMLDLLVVGALPCLLAGALGSIAVPFFLGDEWRETGILVALLSAGGLAQFAVAPFSQILNLAGRNRSLLAWDAARFVLIGLSIGVPGALSLPFSAAVGIFSAVQVIIYLLMAWLCLRAVSNPR